MNRPARVLSIYLVPLAVLSVGCAGLDRAGRKIDETSQHMGSDKPFYEGHLTSSKEVGSMVSLQFNDGQLFDVAKTDAKFVPGDVIRIYKTDKGYEAHIWKASPDAVIPSSGK